MISTGNCFFVLSPTKPTKPTKPTLPFTFHIISHHFTSCHILNSIFFDTLKSPQSTVYPSLQGREAGELPGIHLGPRRQQHSADLRVAFVRCAVQRGDAVEVRLGHGAGHRPQQVPHGAEAAVIRRPEEFVVASGGPRAAPGGHRWKGCRGHNGRQWRPKKSLQEGLS